MVLMYISQEQVLKSAVQQNLLPLCRVKAFQCRRGPLGVLLEREAQRFDSWNKIAKVSGCECKRSKSLSPWSFSARLPLWLVLKL
jgi:hypothetical protein